MTGLLSGGLPMLPMHWQIGSLGYEAAWTQMNSPQLLSRHPSFQLPLRPRPRRLQRLPSLHMHMRTLAHPAALAHWSRPVAGSSLGALLVCVVVAALRLPWLRRLRLAPRAFGT